MGMTDQREYGIKIEVSDGEIKLGRGHAAAVFPDEVVVWTCKDYVFAIQFPPGTPFQVENLGNMSKMTMRKEAQLHVPYKYTIAVHDSKNNKVLILDPVLIPIPPRG